ncbi:ABC transporter permease [candidate division KSB1 bacterium]
MLRLFEKLLTIFSKKRDRDSILNDFEEIYFDISEQKGRFYAAAWSFAQVLRSLPPAFMNFIYWSIVMFKNYFKITFRSIRRYKGYSFINISGLAVGMACCIITLLWVRFELSYNNFHENVDDLYRIIFYNPANGMGDTILPGAIAEHLKSEYPEIIDASIINEPGERKLTYDNNSLNCTGHWVHSSFLKMFSFPLVKGNPDDPFSTKYSIVITEELAKKMFGDEDPIDKRIRVDDRYFFRVTGILKNIPGNSSFKFDFLTPFKASPRDSNLNSWEIWTSRIFVQLQKNSSHEEVSEKISNVYNARMQKESRRNMYLQPFGEIHLHNPNGGGLINYVYIFAGMGIFVLLVACFNFMNLSTACAEKRFREIGIKKVVGSTRAQLIHQFISESVFMSFIALVMAVILVVTVLPVINNLIGQKLILDYSGDIILGLIAITLLTGFVSGSYPAFFLSSFSPLRVLKGHLFSSSHKGSILFRRLLVTTQFTLSISFVICVLVINNQLDYMQKKDLGYDKEHIIRVQMKGRLLARGHILKEALSENSDIISLTRAYSVLTRWESSSSVDWPGRPSGKIVVTGNEWVDFDYLETLDLEMAAGRFFSKEHPSDMGSTAILNEAAVAAMGLDEPLGTTVVRLRDTPYEEQRTVIGIIKDYHTQSLHTQIYPYMLLPGVRGDNMFIRIKPGGITETLEFIRGKVSEIVPDDPFVYSFLDEEIDRLYRNEQVTGKLIVVIAVIAIFISSLGLFGLTAFSAEQRIKEIGIRKALGSSIDKIIMLLSREFVLCILLANFVAWPIAYFSMKRWLNEFVYQTDLGWNIFVISGLAALIISVLTVSFRSYKAATADPVESLRYE